MYQNRFAKPYHRQGTRQPPPQPPTHNEDSQPNEAGPRRAQTVPPLIRCTAPPRANRDSGWGSRARGRGMGRGLNRAEYPGGRPLGPTVSGDDRVMGVSSLTPSRSRFGALDRSTNAPSTAGPPVHHGPSNAIHVKEDSQTSGQVASVQDKTADVPSISEGGPITTMLLSRSYHIPQSAITMPQAHVISTSPPKVKQERIPPPPSNETSPLPSSPQPTHPYSASVSSPPKTIKRERTPSPQPFSLPRRVTSGSQLITPLPIHCRKTAKNLLWKRSREKWADEQKKKLEGKGLKVVKWFLRDDGLALDWTSPRPVWSDTLMPERPLDLISPLDSPDPVNSTRDQVNVAIQALVFDQSPPLKKRKSSPPARVASETREIEVVDIVSSDDDAGPSTSQGPIVPLPANGIPTLTPATAVLDSVAPIYARRALPNGEAHSPQKKNSGQKFVTQEEDIIVIGDDGSLAAIEILDTRHRSTLDAPRLSLAPSQPLHDQVSDDSPRASGPPAHTKQSLPIHTRPTIPLPKNGTPPNRFLEPVEKQGESRPQRQISGRAESEPPSSGHQRYELLGGDIIEGSPGPSTFGSGPGMLPPPDQLPNNGARRVRRRGRKTKNLPFVTRVGDKNANIVSTPTISQDDIVPPHDAIVSDSQDGPRTSGRDGVSNDHRLSSSSNLPALESPGPDSEIDDLVERSIGFLKRYIRLFDTDRLKLSGAYASQATFSCRDSSQDSRLSSSKGLYQGRERILPELMSVPPKYKFCWPAEQNVEVVYDISPLSIEHVNLGARTNTTGCGGILAVIFCKMGDTGPEFGVEMSFVLRRKEWTAEDASISNLWPIVAVSHVMTIRSLYQ
ncbi:hypothetical protein JAAARDRAFT_73883 [Jaapia argillacea MUCL 33604]|uniref:NTF2 domain-containing protein n=1 Tax=Jaapia argillacea MUCL 33604 TaxID=933084 RepID=A0A067PKT1_9AGAM|nr:hypothetical protein JAAARDRAFT_73883 [Jaapia argillacea MUCL 33604]